MVAHKFVELIDEQCTVRDQLVLLDSRQIEQSRDGHDDGLARSIRVYYMEMEHQRNADAQRLQVRARKQACKLLRLRVQAVQIHPRNRPQLVGGQIDHLLVGIGEFGLRQIGSEVVLVERLVPDLVDLVVQVHKVAIMWQNLGTKVYCVLAATGKVREHRLVAQEWCRFEEILHLRSVVQDGRFRELEEEQHVVARVCEGVDDRELGVERQHECSQLELLWFGDRELGGEEAFGGSHDFCWICAVGTICGAVREWHYPVVEECTLFP